MSKLNALILAAGKGTRMKSDKPKVVHECLGKPMVEYVIEASTGAGAEAIGVIVGYKADEVKEVIKEDVTYVLQTEQLGTGHAVKCAVDFIKTSDEVMVLCGDTPLVTTETLAPMIKAHREGKNGVTVLTTLVDDPTGYGRIIKDVNGDFIKIVEQKDATEEEKAVNEINSGMYIFDSKALLESLEKITPNNAQGEYYLTDTIAIIKDMGLRVDSYILPKEQGDEIMGVNTVDALKEAEEIMKARG